jgi:glycerate kinase
MQVLVAPDKFAGTLTAVQAAEAIAEGWRRTAPDDDVVLLPLADGGPGFLDVVAAALGGRRVATTVTGPLGGPVPAAVLLIGQTAYVETAQACGLHLVAEQARDPRRTTSYGVGELVGLAVAEGATTIVLGLGGSGTSDGGAGLLAALGATAEGPEGLDVTARLAEGTSGLGSIHRVDLEPARRAVEGVRLVAASDVDNPLLGLRGAANGFARQKGADDAAVMEIEGALEHLASVLGRRPDGKDPAVALGAGAAGGLGYALLHLGAERVPGIATVLETVRFADRVRSADVVVTGEGSFDWQSLRGKVVSGVAEAALAEGRGCVVLAGRVEVGRREYAATGVSGAYAVVDHLAEQGRPESDAVENPYARLADLAERAARTWGG